MCLHPLLCLDVFCYAYMCLVVGGLDEWRLISYMHLRTLIDIYLYVANGLHENIYMHYFRGSLI